MAIPSNEILSYKIWLEFNQWATSSLYCIQANDPLGLSSVLELIIL